jgi:hypothetical protein
MPLSPTERQQRWRIRKRQAEIDAGLRPRRKTLAKIQRDYRARCKAKAKEAKFAKSRERRRLSRTAVTIPPEFRHGDCREVLLDIGPVSTTLVLGDPPWDDDSIHLVPWFGEFTMRVLVPGGSLLMFMGGDNYLEAADMLRASGLVYCRSLVMLHDQQHWFRRLNLPRPPGTWPKALRMKDILKTSSAEEENILGNVALSPPAEILASVALP